MNKYNEFHIPTISTKKGISYDIPNGLDSDEYVKLIEEFTDLAKVKRLTIRQAQYLFEACKDYVLENSL